MRQRGDEVVLVDEFRTANDMPGRIGPRRAALAVLAVTMMYQVACGPAGQDTDVRLNGTDSLSAFLQDVSSSVVRSSISGREYSISVALPHGYADSVKIYPVLYALDANGQFGTVVETARMLRYGEQIPQLVVVGIGYPYGGRQFDAEPHRIIDFFPVLEHGWIEELRDGWLEPIPEYDTGGAPEFLRFIAEELIPSIQAEYRVSPHDRAIYGHSGGGWFATYALFESPGLFQRAIVGSPSLWWGDNLMFELEEAYASSHSSLPARVFLSIGSDEPNIPFADVDCICMTRNFDRFVEILTARSYEGLEWQAHVFAGENHQSVIPANVSRGLRFIYDGP